MSGTSLRAKYHSSAGENYEIWHAHALLQLSSHYSLPGNIEFALHYHVQGKDYWENNSSHNYFIDADSGIRLRDGIPLLNIEHHPQPGTWPAVLSDHCRITAFPSFRTGVCSLDNR